LGFDGKTLIHPSQVEPANRAFAPDEESLAEARAIIAAYAAPEAQGKGAIQVNGRMVERLHLVEANRLVALAETIAAAS
jgi:citrate lyase subunit beta/citryl-CoA lyase